MELCLRIWFAAWESSWIHLDRQVAIVAREAFAQLLLICHLWLYFSCLDLAIVTHALVSKLYYYNMLYKGAA